MNLLCGVIALAAIGTNQPAEKPLSPADAMVLAWTDAQTVPVEVRPYCRYLSLTSYPTAERGKKAAALSGHLNQLATSPRIYRPEVVAGGVLLRIDLRRYGGTHWIDVWERFSEVNPYFNTPLLVVEGSRVYWPGGYWCQYGRHHDPGMYRIQTKEKIVPAISPFATLTPASAQAAKHLTVELKTGVPIVDAGFFLSRTSIQFKRDGTGYYDWLGIKDRKTYEKLIGFDAKLAESARFRELLEAVAVSGVGRGQARRIEADKSIGGRYWRTKDSAVAIGNANPLRIHDRDALKHQAEEAVTLKSNGFIAWGLWDQEGKRQDFAPVEVVGFNQRGHFSNDGAIHVCYGCINCHYLDKDAKSGFKSINGFVRKTFADVTTPNLVDPNGKKTPEDVEKFEEQYLVELEGPLEADRLVHGRSVLAATDLTPEQWATVYTEMFRKYEAEVDLNRAAWYIGMTPQELHAAWTKHLDAQPLDFVVKALLRGESIGIRQFEEIFPLAIAAAHGIVLPTPTK